MALVDNFRTVGIVGSGIMGAGIAEVVSRSSLDVIVCSRSQQSTLATRATIEASLNKQVSKEKISQEQSDLAMSHLRLTSSLEDLASCDLIIESVIENLDVKQKLFAQLDQIARTQCVLASNTSTLPIIELAKSTNRPDKVCGLHFFNPAVMMSLVEVVRPITATDETIALANSFVAACGKDAVQVVDRAGFIVNALLFPYLNSAVAMFEAGTATMADIDTAMKGGCNFPMGPFALLDLIGLDTSVAILEALFAETQAENLKPCQTLQRLVAQGKLGRKTKQGFFSY